MADNVCQDIGDGSFLKKNVARFIISFVRGVSEGAFIQFLVLLTFLT